MPINQNPKETDITGLICGSVAVGAVISTIIGGIVAIFLKNNESSELRENNIALRKAGAEAFEIIQYHSS